MRLEIKNPGFGLWHAFSVLAIMLSDQAAKHLIKHGFRLGQSIDVTTFFQLARIENTGIAFGFFRGMNVLLICVITVIIAMLVYFSPRIVEYAGRLSRISLVMILGGALGNLIDRIFYGRITDFLYFGYGGYYFPAFNVADACVSVGGVSLALMFIIRKDPEKTPAVCRPVTAEDE